MSQAEELLQGLAAGATTFSDDVDYVSIENRRLIVPAHLQRLGVSADHGVNTIHFVGPRYSENGTDLSKMNVYVNYRRSEDDYEDKALCTNVAVDSSDDSLLHYDWVITRNVTEVPGNVTVVVCAKESDGTGNEDEHWNTELYSDFYVSEGMEVDGDGIINQQPDLVDSMLDRINTVENKTTTSSMLGYVDKYLDENPEVITDHIEDIVADQPIQEFVEGYLDDYVDIGTTGSRVLEGSVAGAYEMVSMEGASEQKTLEGKNFYRGTEDRIAVTSNGITYTQKINESELILDAAATKESSLTPVRGLHLPAGTYTVSVSGLTVTNTSTDRIYITRESDGAVVKNYVQTGKPGTFTLDEDTDVNISIVFGNGSSYSNKKIQIQIEAGTVATPYEPYCGGTASPNPDYPQEIKSVGPEVTVKTTNVDGTLSSTAKIALPEPLRGIGDVRDIIEKRAGKWGVERRIKRVVFDGSADEVWAQSSSRTDLFFTTMKDIKVNYCRAKCNQYIEQIVSANLKDGDMYAYNSYFGIQRVSFINSSCETLDGWKSQLQSNPITVDYELATPTWEELDEATQEALDSLQAYDGTTHVFVEGTEVQPIVTSKYGTSEVGARALSNTRRIEEHEEECDQRIDLLEIQTSEDYEIHGCKAGGLRLLEMDGTTEQKTLSGKNLWSFGDVTVDDVYTTKQCKLEAESYVISAEVSSSSATVPSFLMLFTLASGSSKYVQLPNNSNVRKSVAVTFNESVTKVLLYTANDSSSSSGLTTSYSKIQIEAGTVATDFEEYCGGTPSPNPLFPQAIENTFDCVEMIQGKWDTTTGNFANSSNLVSNKYPIPCKSGDVVKIVAENSLSRIFVMFYNENGYISWDQNAINSNVYEYALPSNGATHFKFSLYNENGLPLANVGKITLTVNGKYVGQIIEHGKNLVKPVGVDTTKAGLTFTDNKDGTFTVKGTATGNTSFNIMDVNICPIVFKQGVPYSLTMFKLIGSGGIITTSVKSADGTTKNNFIKSGNTVTPTEDCTLSSMSLYVSSGTTVNCTFCVQLEKGEATPYEPYTKKVTTFFLNEPLRATDRLVRKDGVIYENHRRGSVDLGTLSWTLVEDKYWRANTLSNMLGRGNSVCANILGEKYMVTEANYISTASGTNKIALNNSSLNEVKKAVYIYCNNGSTTEKPSGMLEYELAEETLTPLDTASQLALNDMVTFDGVTYIEVDSKVKPTSISGEYGTSQVGAYTLKCMNDNDTDRVEREEMKARLDEMAVMIVAMGSEV